MLFACYRRGDANDPDAYVRAVAVVLAMYEPDLMREVTDPRTGIMTTEKYMTFMPNAGELKVYCDGVARHRAHIKRLGDLPVDKNMPRLAPPPPGPGRLANVFIPETSIKYARLVEWAKTADESLWRYQDGRAGIYVARGVVEDGHVVVKPLKAALGDALNAAAKASFGVSHETGESDAA